MQKKSKLNKFEPYTQEYAGSQKEKSKKMSPEIVINEIKQMLKLSHIYSMQKDIIKNRGIIALDSVFLKFSRYIV
ncbi:MAG: hypothetical protein DRG39_07540 [Deltaproteobacteria bacterium]|nr:MAG: hypothetical protein DRG39_07540 [Deltaproteobacteria bacterium]